MAHQTSSTIPLGHAHDEGGFSLIELIVATALAAEVLLIALLLFDVHAQVSRVQTQVADLQQNQRVAHDEIVDTFRLAGRGGLPVQWAFKLIDDADPATDLVAGNIPVAGTDILTVRGVIKNPIYQIKVADPNSFTRPAGSQLKGTIQIDSFTPSGVEQPLDALVTALQKGRPEALVMMSSLDPSIYAVVEILGTSNIQNIDVNGDGVVSSGEKRVVVDYSAKTSNGTHNAAYLAMSQGGTFPNTLTKVIYAGVLEEYRYYIRDVQDAAGGWEPKLSRAQFYPNTNAVYAGDTANATVDVAENILDLQVAEGRDRAPSNGLVDENPADQSDDDWLYNDPNDDDTQPIWVGAPFLHLRIHTLATTQFGERGYVDAPIMAIEDHVYGESTDPATLDETIARQHRRRELRTIIEARNL